MDFKKIVELDKYITIAHHIPGRIRIKFSLAAAGHPEVKNLMKEKPKMPQGVLSTKLNLLARSVLIEYDPNIIHPEWLATLVEGKNREEKIALLEKFHAA